jgi:tetratricopeptide (TPR) repeat protein
MHLRGSYQKKNNIEAQVAQSVEQRTENPRVGSSILSLGIKYMNQINTNELLNRALALHHQRKFEEADAIYLMVIENDDANFQANHLHGCILAQKLQHKEAISYFLKAIRVNSDNYEVNNNLGISYKSLNNQTASEKYFNKAISIDNKNYKAFFNCANLYIDNSRYLDALEYLEIASNVNTLFAEAPQRIGEVYQYMFQDDRNIEHLEKSKYWFLQAIEKDPNYTESYLMLGMSYLWLGNISKADELFKKVLKLNHSKDAYVNNYTDKYLSSIESLTTLIKHEFEQLTYIDNDTDGIRNPKFTKKYYDSLKKLYEKVQKDSLSLKDITTEMQKDIFKVLYNKAPKDYSANLLNTENNISSLESKYLNSNPEILVIDNFLSSNALKELQYFCRNANIFKYSYPSGYVAAFLSKGLSNQFILKLSEDLRLTYKNIFKELRLTQAWIFKYDSKKKGTNIHADQATVNVNFWITPEIGNQDKSKGGLKIWNKLPPKESSFDSYNSLDSSPGILKMLNDNNISNKVIPYKENRAVIFNSQLYHATDDFSFEESYENMRINITFLYD